MITEQWIKTYKPIKNKWDTESLYDGCLFGTIGSAISDVRKSPHTNVWTLISGDNETMWIVPGFRRVDREGYFITELPWEDENLLINDNEVITIVSAASKVIVFCKELDYKIESTKLIMGLIVAAGGVQFKDIAISVAYYTSIEFLSEHFRDLTDEEEMKLRNLLWI